jgi:hypothetical protein
MGNINTLTCELIKIDSIPEEINVVGQGRYAAFYACQHGSHNEPTAFKFESAQDKAIWINYVRKIHINFATFYDCIEDGEQAPEVTGTLEHIKYIKNNHGSEFVPLSIQEYTTDIENRYGLPLTFTQD